MGKHIAGCYGELHPRLGPRFDLAGRVLVFEFNLRVLSEIAAEHAPQYRPLSIYPAVKRDFALLAPESVTAQQVEDSLRKAGESLLEDLTIFDYYRGKQVAEGMVSLGFRLTFRSDKETLTEETVEPLCSRMLERLRNELSVQIRT